MKNIIEVLRQESDLEKSQLPIPTLAERDYAYMLLPNTPLNKDDAHNYGALMFALGRRETTMAVLAWINENNKNL